MPTSSDRMIYFHVVVVVLCFALNWFLRLSPILKYCRAQLNMGIVGHGHGWRGFGVLEPSIDCKPHISNRTIIMTHKFVLNDYIASSSSHNNSSIHEWVSSSSSSTHHPLSPPKCHTQSMNINTWLYLRNTVNFRTHYHRHLLPRPDQTTTRTSTIEFMYLMRRRRRRCLLLFGGVLKKSYAPLTRTHNWVWQNNILNFGMESSEWIWF